jgi:hypothetical protein
MKLNSYQVYLRGIKKLFRKEDSRFLLTTGLKFSLVFLFVTAFLVYILWIMISLNNIFFEAHGYMGIDDFRSAYLNFVTSSLWDSINFVLGFFILLFILGVYIGTILIRPFKTIGEYAAVATEDGSAEFNPEPFSDFRVLNRFSDFFFRYLKDMAFHLYSKVSGAAFGFFATMRGYMKGNYFARVHLLEYNHVRPYGRMLNKYLDYMQKNFS